MSLAVCSKRRVQTTATLPSDACNEPEDCLQSTSGAADLAGVLCPDFRDISEQLHLCIIYAVEMGANVVEAMEFLHLAFSCGI